VTVPHAVVLFDGIAHAVIHRPAGLRPQVSRRSQEDEKKKRQTSFDRYLCIHHDRKKANDVPEM